MQLEVQTARVTYWFSIIVPSPKGSGSGAAIRAAQAKSSGGSLQWERLIKITRLKIKLNEGKLTDIHFVCFITEMLTFDFNLFENF